MLPISDIPLPLREFAEQFRNVFKHPAQREYFEIILTGLIASDNRTLAGIHQRLVNDVDYGGLHHFMTDSPWSHDALRQARLEWTSKRLASQPGAPRVVAIDSTLIHHYGDQIHGVYWYYDYVNHNFCLGQKLVAATFVSPGATVPLGMELYHRGFLNEQKLYLEATKPAATAAEEEWDEFHSLVKRYEENCEIHHTQTDLAGNLVDECEQNGIPADVYVLDGAFLDIDLMDRIEGYGRAWVTRLAKNRHVQLPSGKFDTVDAFAKSLPREAFQPVTLRTRLGEERTYWVFAKNTKVKFWKKLRVGKRREIGRVSRMKESYDEGLANHIGPESCAGSRKDTREALTGVCAGGVLSLEKFIAWDADTVHPGGRQHQVGRKRQDIFESHVVIDPKHAQKYSTREPGGPVIIPVKTTGIASGSRKGMSRR